MELILLDDSLQICHEPIEDFYSLQWIEEWEKEGNFAISLSPDYYPPFRNARYLYNSDSDSTGMIEQVNYNETVGRKTLSVKGRELNALFLDIVLPVTVNLKGNMEEQLRKLVQDFAITGAQKLDLLQLGELVGYHESVYTQVTGLTLSEALYKLLLPLGMSWRLRYDYQDNIIYFEILKGKNRTQDQTENGWAIFSASYENIKNKQLLYSDAEYKNFAYVAGADVGTSRIVVEVDNTHGEKRRSLYVDARDLQPEEGTDVDKFFICGQGGNIYSSLNGLSWQKETSGTTNGLQRPSYNDGVYFACGRSGTILTSDGSGTWTKQTSGTTQNLQGSIYHNGLYLVVGSQGTILASTDGITWKAQTSGSTSEIFSVIRGKDHYFACGQNGYIYKSPDGYRWERKQITSGTLYMMIYAGYQYITVGSAGAIFRSKDGNTWTQQTSGTTSNISSIAYGNGIYVATGAGGLIVRSVDGANWQVRSSGVSGDLYASA